MSPTTFVQKLSWMNTVIGKILLLHFLSAFIYKCYLINLTNNHTYKKNLLNDCRALSGTFTETPLCMIYLNKYTAV